jgi:hypothetical protein
MKNAESDLVDNLEIRLNEVATTERTAVLDNTYAYDAAFMVGRDQPPSFIDDTPGNTEELAEVEQLTIEQASKILAVSEERVRELIKDDTLCCSDTDENDEPRLSAACVRAQAGKSKLEFVQEVKRLIAGENNKRRKTSVDLPADADVCLQELFDASSPFGAIRPTEMVPGNAMANTETTTTTTTTTTTKPTTIKTPGAKTSSTARELRVRGIDRAEITNKSLESVLENLDFSSVRLEGAMYRIGYLEAKLDDLQKELQIIPELRAKWAKSLILERENEEYRETIAKREHELLEVHQMLDKIKESWWCRAWCWFTGLNLK